MARGHRRDRAAAWPAPRRLRRRVVREQADQRVEELRLAHRLREVGAEEPLGVAGLAPAERAEQHQRQRRVRARGCCRASARPSISGMCMSRIARSNASPASSQRSASARRSRRPRTACPTCRSAAASTRRLVALSSTTSTRLPSSSGCTPTKSRCRAAGSSAVGAAIVNRNVEPLPGPSLSAHMRPPISSARRLLIARPRPVPPYLRVVEESAWENDWNRRPMPSGERPMPVSRTANVSSTSAAGGRGRADGQHDLAGLGELHGVGEQVEQDLAQPRHVARDRRAARRPRTGRRCRGPSRPRAAPRGRAPTRRTRAGRTAAPRCPSGPASIFEKSRMSLMIVSSASPESRIVVGVVALLGVERRVEQEPAHADHRVHRRADLVAHRREERALGLVGGLGGGARFLGLLEQAGVLDRDHRLVGERLQQVRRPCSENAQAASPGAPQIAPMRRALPDHRRDHAPTRCPTSARTAGSSSGTPSPARLSG